MFLKLTLFFKNKINFNVLFVHHLQFIVLYSFTLITVYLYIMDILVKDPIFI